MVKYEGMIEYRYDKRKDDNMGYQEAIFKPKNKTFQEFMEYIIENKKELEDPPYGYCHIPSIITFKKVTEGLGAFGEVGKFEKGESYIWAAGQRSAVIWLISKFDEGFINIDSDFIESVPIKALEGFKEYISKFENLESRGTFQNEYVIIKPINYTKGATA